MADPHQALWFSENVSSNFYPLCHLLGIGGYYFGDKDISIGVACELRREGGKKHKLLTWKFTCRLQAFHL